MGTSPEIPSRMNREIRLPAPHPQFRPRRESEGRTAGYPGTAVRIGKDLFEVVSSENAEGTWVYRLEPWTGNHIIRVFVEWGDEAEGDFIAALRKDRIRERKRILAWGTQALLGFLPAKHQERLSHAFELNPVRASFWSALLETAVALPFATLFVITSFAGGGGRFGGYIPTWAGAAAITAAAEGILRLIIVFSSGDPVGSLLFVLLGFRLKPEGRDEVMADEYASAGAVLNVTSPVPKVWWERAGGVVFEGEAYILAESHRAKAAFYYRFRKGGEGFPVLDPVKERDRNIASDRSYVLAPLWGFLPPAMQSALEFYGRYRSRPYVLLSIAFNGLAAAAIMGSGFRNITQGVFELWNLLCFGAGLFLFLESVLRLLRHIKDGEVTGSVLAVLVKPIYYMAIKPGAEGSGDLEGDRK
jgi:hypothetical protein